MAALTSQSIVAGATTPTAFSPSASDTILEGQFGPNGLAYRVITTGTTTNVTISDPGASAMGNPGTAAVLAMPATGVRMIFISRAAINPATGSAALAHSGALTGVTAELYRI